jgi:hypothetical protein
VKRAALLLLLSACPSKPKPIDDCSPGRFAERVHALKDPGERHLSGSIDDLQRVAFARRIDGEGTYVESAAAGSGDRLLVKGARMVSADGGTPFVDPAYRESVSTIDARDRASIAAAGLEQAVSRCPAASKVLKDVQHVSPERKLQFLIDGIAETAPSCTCEQVDFPLVEGWINEVANEWYAPLGWVPLQR